MGQLLQELKRRNVIRVAVAFAVAAWILIEVTSTIFPILKLPVWSVTFVTVLLLFSFPLVLVFSWAYEITPEGIKKEKDVDHSESVTRETAKKLDIAVIVLLLLAIGGVVADHLLPDATTPSTEPMADHAAVVSAPDQSIAVLAFENLSPDPDNAYFAEGISEEILNVLAGIDGLKVTSRTSAFSFRGSDTSIPEIARQLGVRHVLEGSVRKQGMRVRVSAQLIDAVTDVHLWSDSYDREMSDIFLVQEEIAQSITTAMQGVLGVRTVKVNTPTEDLEAYQLFLLGRQLFHKRGPALDAAIEALQTAVNRDAAFAEAWAYLAAAAVAALPGGYGTVISQENALAIAEEASQRALELDPNQGLAIAVRAELALEVYRDLNNAFDLYHRAVDADPDNSTSRQWLGQIVFYYGYLSEAVANLERAYELDPLVGVNNGVLGNIYLASGQEALARPLLAKGDELGWANWPVKFHHLILSAEYESAIAYLGPYWPNTKDPDLLRTSHLLTEAVRDRDPASVDALVAQLDAKPVPRRWGRSLFLVFDHKDRFFEHFSRSVAESTRWHYVMAILWLPGYRPYVEDPRFLAIMSEADTVGLWEQRGYPDGCVRVSDPAGDRLDCAERYR